MEKNSGIVGFTRSFKKTIEDVKDNSKIVFTGSVAVCTPFIELLSYAIRDKNFELIYVPKANVDKAMQIKFQPNIGYSIINQEANPQNPDVVVIFGGLTMPKSGCEPETVLKMLKKITTEQKPKIIGVSFMNIFESSGWIKKIPFDKIIDTSIETKINCL